MKPASNSTPTFMKFQFKTKSTMGLQPKMDTIISKSNSKTLFKKSYSKGDNFKKKIHPSKDYRLGALIFLKDWRLVILFPPGQSPAESLKWVRLGK